MKAIRLFLFVISLVITAVSCCKADNPVPTKVGNVVFGCYGGTKSSTISTGSVQTLDLLVFRQSDGVLEYYTRVTGENVTANVTTGLSYVYYLVANAPQNVLDHCASLTDFLNLVWPLTDMESGMAMVGTGQGLLYDNDTVKVGLNRLPAKVTLEGITPSFLEHSFKSSTIKLERVFLINVNGSCLYCGIPSVGTTWYNKLQIGSTTESVSKLLEIYSGKTLSGTEKITDVFDLFCCPNPINNGVTSLTETTWSVRNTRLVIELSIDGVPNYYPIDMPQMACNTNYIVKNAVLTGPGSSSPDIPVNRASISFSITVNPWEKDNSKILDF